MFTTIEITAMAQRIKAGLNCRVFLFVRTPQIQRCLEVVAAYRASGQKGKVWAQANGVPERSLGSWYAHTSRRGAGRSAHADALCQRAIRSALACGPCC